MQTEICCIFNLAPHYRAPIYQLMDKELACDFYFGDKVQTPIKKLDYTTLVGFKSEVQNVWIMNTSFIWQRGALKLLLKKYKYYVLTGDPNIVTNWLILIFGKLLRKKVMVWSHGMKSEEKVKNQWFELYFYKLCHKVLLYGDYSKGIMIRKGFDPEKLICIYNSLDYENQLLIRNNLKISRIYNNHFKNSYPVILYIGRIQKNKNLELLVQAVHLLNKKESPCNLVFVGGDIGDNNVSKTVLELNLMDRVWFFGPCYNEESIGDLIYNAAVCVSPGPVGLTALHSLTYGTPVISNDNFSSQMPEHEVIIENKTGSFFTENSIDDLIIKIQKWLNLNDQKRESIRENCYTIIEQKWNPIFQIQILKKLIRNE